MYDLFSEVEKAKAFMRHKTEKDRNRTPQKAVIMMTILPPCVFGK
jgi:hypothetical protein